MENLERKALRKIVAIIVIVLLTLSDFLFVGNSLVSYALDVVNTDNENVEFMAYFLNDEGEKIDKIEQNIDKEARLKIDISVKQEGYFNGKIVLTDSNFNFKLGQENEYISQVTEDTIMLNQINAESTLNLDLVIEPKVSNEINMDFFRCETKVLLQGRYINSKNVESRDIAEISEIDVVEVGWKSSENSSVQLDSNILTNLVYNENGEEKRVVQILVNSNITENNFPVKNNIVVMKVPENVIDVKVHTRSTEGTNSNIDFSENNYQYNEQNNTLKIRLQNSDDNNICWNKDTKDTFVVTYTFSKDENLEGKEIVVGNLINTYDDKNITAKQSIEITEDINGIISSSVRSSDDIFKGKIYTGEEREYSSKTTVNVDYLNVLDKIEITQKESTFVKGEEELSANIVYKATKIDKNEFFKMFGEDGFVTIKDDKGAVVANIDKNSQTDERGIITVNYENQPKGVEIITSKPMDLGRFNIENTKAVLASGYEREVIDEINAIKDKVATNQKEQDGLAILKDTESVAEVKVNPTVIIASNEAEQMEIEATLLANDETKDLYKNPTVSFVFSKELQMENAKFKVLYKNGLEVDSSSIVKSDEGEDILQLKFVGEQTSYEYTGGTKIYVRAEVKPNKEIETKETAIKMIYTNENKNQTKEIDAGLVLEAAPTIEETNDEIHQNQNRTLSMQTQNVSDTNNNTEEQINVSVTAIAANKELTENENIYEGQTVSYKITVTNNTGIDYDNVEIKANQKNGYVWDLNEMDSVNHYYSEDTIKENYYKVKESNEISIIKLDHLKNGDSYTFSYETSTYLLNNENIDGSQTYGTIYVTSNENVLNETQTVKNTIKSAELKVDFLEGNSREYNWFSNSHIDTQLSIENLTENELNDVKVQVVLLKNLNWGDEESDLDNCFIYNSLIGRIEIEGKQTNEEGKEVVNMTISSIGAHEKITIKVNPYTDEFGGDESFIEMNANVKTSAGNIYSSNNLKRTIFNNIRDINVMQEMKHIDGSKIDDSDYVLKDNDIVKIIGTVENREENAFNSNITYNIDSAFEVQNAAVLIGEEEKNVLSNINANEINLEDTQLGANSKLQIVITAKVKANNAKETKLKNYLAVFDRNTDRVYDSEVTIAVEEIKQTTNIETEKTIVNDDKGPKTTNINIEPNSDYTEIEENGKNGEGNQKDTNNTEDNSKEEGKIVIKGTVWIDKNQDGKRTNDEEKVKDLKVGALNIETNKLVETTQTDTNGEYKLSVPKGKYIVVFFYNDGLYKITEYQSSNATNTDNSDVVSRQLSIDGETIEVGATDTLNISSDISNIDMGLINKNTFDLKIQKYVSKITVTNSAGTKTYEQKDNTTLAKVEIKSKNLKDSLVVIEYKIKVTNTGDVEGYAKQIVDYMPSSLSFNSSLNKDWYKSGEYLYNSSLANTKIKPGETKELTLIATKKMTESNTGLINNKAEISSKYNVLGLEDKTQDKASADVIISIGTGTIISYITITLSVITLLFSAVYVMDRKIRE